jgi:hypothetical protein
MRRRLLVLLALTCPALLVVACLGPVDKFEDPCTSYNRGPLARPTSATLLTDTLDLRSGPETLFVALEGYTPEADDYTLWLDAIDPALPRGYDRYHSSLAPLDSNGEVYFAEDGPCVRGGDTVPCFTTGAYQVVQLSVYRPGGSCVFSGEYDDWVYLTPSQLGMADSQFVILGSDPPLF